MQIQNSFFKQRIKGRLPKLKGFQRSYSYLQSPEYTDLELVLHEFAKNQTTVMFVIPPVNERWATLATNSDMTPFFCIRKRRLAATRSALVPF